MQSNIDNSPAEKSTNLDDTDWSTDLFGKLTKLLQNIKTKKADNKGRQCSPTSCHLPDKTKLYYNIVDWSQHTNIDGSYYVFEQGVHHTSRMVWTCIWLTLFCFSITMSVDLYVGWREQPVETTVKTPVLQVEEVEFPAVTICGMGSIPEMIDVAYKRQILRYLKNRGLSVEGNALRKYEQDFVEENYPGATLTPVEMAAMMASMNPDEYVKAEMDNEFSACSNDTQGKKLCSSLDYDQKKMQLVQAFHSLDTKGAYNNLFELLWYSQLPCFDVDGFHDFPHQRSILRQCKWKGIKIPCSAIFKTVPTDRGMCCSFNMKAADEIFNNSTYATMLSFQQKADMHSSGLPEWYVKAAEPTSQNGINRGLSVTLDAHTDLVGSVSELFQGFVAIVNAKDSFPMASRKSIVISTGQETLVAMTAVDIQADLQDMTFSARKCYYPEEGEENKLIAIHKNYSQANCLLECQISYATNRMAVIGEKPCVPWYLPALDNNTVMCNPWSAMAFREQVALMPKDHCSHCLIDCRTTIYKQSVTNVPFRRCDRKNVVGNLCSLYEPNLTTQGKQVNKNLNQQEFLLKDSKTNNIRYYTKPTGNESNDALLDNSYDLYQKDIAVVHFYFSSSTVFQYSRDPNMTLADFLSQLAGIVGLFLGFSFCMGVEILYWSTFRFWVDISTEE